MPRRPKPARRWLTAATWPIGVALTSWDYLWRSTPMHRQETVGSSPEEDSPLLALPSAASREEVLGHEDGHGPLFRRRYRTRIRDAELSAAELIEAVKSDPGGVAPTTFARFQKVLGEKGSMTVGDEYVVRMPGPWDGPVRVIAEDDRSFRLATLSGHLEAGQIEFRAREDSGRLVFEIESWARSSSRLSNLLYHNLRMAKEVQAHMWISFLERVVARAGGRMTGGIDLDTERFERGSDGQ